MCTRCKLVPTRHSTLGWPVPKDQQNRTDAFLSVSCNFIALMGHKILLLYHSLIHFLLDCIIFHQHASTKSTSKFHDVHSIKGYLCRLYVCRLQCEKAAATVMISPSLIESSMFFFQSKPVIYCKSFFIIRSKAYDIVLVVDPVFY